jgi:hypothetical protein
MRHLAGALALGVALISAARSAAAQQGPSVKDSAALTVESGSLVKVELKQEITSARNKVGDTVAAVLTRDVTDHDGRVVFPSGSEARLVVTAMQPPMQNRDDARILLRLVSASTGSNAHPVISSRFMSVKAPIVSQRLAGSKAPIEYAVPEGAAIEFHLGAAVTVQ